MIRPHMRRAHRSAPILLVAFLSTPALAQERVGVGLDLWGEGSQRAGEVWINNSRIEENQEYGSLGVGGSAWLLFSARERVRAGPGIRVLGNHGSGEYTYGFLSEAFLLGEYSIPSVVEKFDAILGGRVGLAVLVPGGDFGEEIARLQREGAGVLSVPRLGWLAGVDLGTRRQMTEKLWLRADLVAHYEQLFLFATDEVIDDLRFRKWWNTHTVRVGLLLGVELAL